MSGATAGAAPPRAAVSPVTEAISRINHVTAMMMMLHSL